MIAGRPVVIGSPAKTGAIAIASAVQPTASWLLALAEPLGSKAVAMKARPFEWGQMAAQAAALAAVGRVVVLLEAELAGFGSHQASNR